MPMAVSYTVIDGEIVSETRGGVSKAYAPDSLGSTIALYDASGNITDTWEYWPYGEVRTRTGTTPTPFQYVGTLGYYTDSTGNLYVRARSYQPKTTRWMSVDPLWPSESAYDYCRPNPITQVDPTGLTVILCYRNVCPGLGFKMFCHWYFITAECGAFGHMGPGKGIVFGKGSQTDGQEPVCEVLNLTKAQEKCLCANAKNAQRGWKLCGVTWGANDYSNRSRNCQHFLNALMAKCTGTIITSPDWGAEDFDWKDCVRALL